MSKPVKVHLGSGPHLMPGWVNVDYNPDFKPDVVADLSEDFPFESASVDFIHSEGVLCQFNLESGQHFLDECFRILKPGGAMRVLSPDLECLLRAYLEDMNKNSSNLVELWRQEVPIPLKLGSSAEVINIGIRDLHNFVYDAVTLTMALDNSGFISRQVAYQESGYEALKGLDVRSPENATYMYFECVKPGQGNTPAVPDA